VGDVEQATVGVTDATSFAANGKPQVVIDWKSDVDPAPQTIEHYRAQVRNYLETMGVENGLIVLVTSGTVVPVKASVMGMLSHTI
jgi:exodeoxyribonuclease-5